MLKLNHLIYLDWRRFSFQLDKTHIFRGAYVLNLFKCIITYNDRINICYRLKPGGCIDSVSDGGEIHPFGRTYIPYDYRTRIDGNSRVEADRNIFFLFPYQRRMIISLYIYLTGFY